MSTGRPIGVSLLKNGCQANDQFRIRLENRGKDRFVNDHKGHIRLSGHTVADRCVPFKSDLSPKNWPDIMLAGTVL